MRDSESVDPRNEIGTWHDKHTAVKYEFNFLKELFAYCASDVQLL